MAQSGEGGVSTEGWVAKYLRDCQGDHHAAIKKFLDFVAEFAATRLRHQPGI
jgi:hypothetical protein